MKYIVYIIICFLALPLRAGEWKIYTSQIEAIPEPGYYHIELTPELIGLSGNNPLRTLRILDAEGAEVPYFLHTEEMKREENNLLYYELAEKTAKDSLNKIIVINKEKEFLHRFLIVTKPAEVSTSVQIRGSNDNKDWYIVKQPTPVRQKLYSYSDKDILPVDFPSGNYLFYEIIIQNSGQSPLDITGVAKTEYQSMYNTLSPLPEISFIQKDSTDKNTYIYFTNLPQNYQFNRVDFFINYTGDYYRKVNYRPDRHYSFTLTSQDNNIFYTENSIQLTKESFFRIENQNNPVLKIDSIRFYGLNHYVCAFLSAGEYYILRIDESQTEIPHYDIEHFRTKIPRDIPILKTFSPTLIIKESLPEKREQLWIEKPAVLWSILILIGAILIFICWKVMKEMKNKEDSKTQTKQTE